MFEAGLKEPLCAGSEGRLEAGYWTDFEMLEGNLNELESLSVSRTTVGNVKSE